MIVGSLMAIGSLIIAILINYILEGRYGISNLPGEVY